MPSNWVHLIVWEFHIDGAKRELFERSYGPEGDWARFFRRSPDYLGTELGRDEQNPERYLTFDFWKSEQAFAGFKEQNHEEYASKDLGFESLTRKEVKLGTFSRIG
jgi:heme-degrading monooxygenase HmoA